MKLIIEIENHEVDSISRLLEYIQVLSEDTEIDDAVEIVLKRIMDKATEKGWRPQGIY